MDDRMKGVFVLDLSKLSQKAAEEVLKHAEVVLSAYGHNWGMQKPERKILEDDRQMARILRRAVHHPMHHPLIED
jgi:hypothetical protein